MSFIIHFEYPDLDWILYDSMRVSLLELGEFQTAWNPKDSNRPIYGPCCIEYIMWPDGYVAAMVSDKDFELHLERAQDG